MSESVSPVFATIPHPEAKDKYYMFVNNNLQSKQSHTVWDGKNRKSTRKSASVINIFLTFNILIIAQSRLELDWITG